MLCRATGYRWAHPHGGAPAHVGGDAQRCLSPVPALISIKTGTGSRVEPGLAGDALPPCDRVSRSVLIRMRILRQRLRSQPVTMAGEERVDSSS